MESKPCSNNITEIIEELRSLHIRESQLLSKLAQINEFNEKNKKTSKTEPHTYQKGDRVRITNRINKFVGKRIVKKDKVGTVTRTSHHSEKGHKVFLTTDNGLKTWRHSKNITLIDEQPNRINCSPDFVGPADWSTL